MTNIQKWIDNFYLFFFIILNIHLQVSMKQDLKLKLLTANYENINQSALLRR